MGISAVLRRGLRMELQDSLYIFLQLTHDYILITRQI